MDYVVLDTDVASLSFRGRLPSGLARPLAGKVTCVSFVTIGEMTKWAELRDWGPRNRDRLGLWLNHQIHLEYDITVAQTWGRLSAAAQRRGRSAPRGWHTSGWWPNLYRCSRSVPAGGSTPHVVGGQSACPRDSTVTLCYDNDYVSADEAVDRALTDLASGDRDCSQVIREAILAAWRARRAERLRVEAEAVAADPDDRAEARAVLADMESLRAW